MANELQIISTDAISLDTLENRDVLNELIGEIRNKIKETGVLAMSAETEDGRKQRKDLARKINKTMTALDDAGKTKVSVIKEQANIIDNWRKHWCDNLKGFRQTALEPVKAYDERMAQIETNLNDMKTVLTELPTCHSANDVDEVIKVLQKLHDFDYEQSTATANEQHELTMQACVEKKELLEMRAEKEQAEKKQAEADRINKMAEEKAKTIVAEQTTLVQATTEQPTETVLKTPTVDEQGLVNRSILNNLMELGCTEELGMNIVRATRQGKINHLTIKG